jgi:putative Ca2+/H+ antiporter (TMEM165/GDT1 family)
MDGGEGTSSGGGAVAWREISWCLLLSYWTVLTAELIGDRSIFTIASLSARYPPRRVFCGLAAAFMSKMLVAVLLGRALFRLPVTWTGTLSAAAFFGSAIVIWYRRGQRGAEAEATSPSHGAVVISFLSVFCSEWADLGQVSAAALVTRLNAPAAVWLGGSLALCTKGMLALTLGWKLRERVPERLARALAASSCLVLGVVTLCELIQPPR